MNFLISLLYGFVTSITASLAETALKSLARFTALITVTLGLFTAFIAATFALLNSIKVVAPQKLGFILSLLPSEIFIYINIYLTIYIMRLVYEYKVRTVEMVSADWHKKRAGIRK